MPKTLPQKFFLKEGYRILVVQPPKNFLTERLVPLPEKAAVSTQNEFDHYDVLIYFVKTQQDADAALPTAVDLLLPDSYLWLCYPKGGKKAAIPTDLNRDSLWEIAVKFDLKAVHQISIDDTWSALRFRWEDSP